MSRVLLAHAHHRNPVRTAFRRQIEIHDFRKLLCEQRDEYFVQRHAEDRRLVGRLAGVGAVIDRIAAHGDTIDRQHRKRFLLVVIAGVIAERAFGRRVSWMDASFQDDLRRSGYLQIGTDALGKFGLRSTQQPGELVLGERVRNRRHRAENGGRIGTERHRDRERLTRVGETMVAKIQRATSVRQPAHDHLVAGDDLLAVDAQVLPRLVRPARDRQPPGDQRSRVFRPARLDRKPGQIDLGTLPDDLLARRA